MKKKPLVIRIALGLARAVAIFVVAFALLFVFLMTRKKPVVFNEQAAAGISYSPLEKVIPGDGLPPEIKPDKSNNNLDIIRYDGLYFMSFRSAPTHFASTKTQLHVMSSTDGKKWKHEKTFKMNDDLREPRFLCFKGKLFLYFFRGGSNPLSFEPQSMYATVRENSGWSEPRKIYEPGFVIWRAKEKGGKAYMSVYYGAGLYSNETEPGKLRLLESTDGINYKMVGGRQADTTLSAEEGEFEFDEEGNLYATVRLEMLGGKVCFAKKDSLSDWKCKYTKHKYDSALMFRRGDEFYVVARRNLDGPYYKDSRLIPKSLRSKVSLVRYSATRKRTSLYRLNKEKLELEPLFDFQSIGDTAYAGIAETGPNTYLLMNYSCDIDGFDWNWIAGQLVGTNIYSTTLKFEE